MFKLSSFLHSEAELGNAGLRKKCYPTIGTCDFWQKRSQTKILEVTKFAIEYLNHKGALALYYPDFVAEQKRPDDTSTMWLIETKGQEFPDVALKDKRAEEWCRDATKLTDREWRYLKVKYADYSAATNSFKNLPAKSFQEFLKTL